MCNVNKITPSGKFRLMEGSAAGAGPQQQQTTINEPPFDEIENGWQTTINAALLRALPSEGGEPQPVQCGSGLWCLGNQRYTAFATLCEAAGCRQCLAKAAGSSAASRARRDRKRMGIGCN